MFTGLIEDLGKVGSRRGSDLVILSRLCNEVRKGDSMAVDGSCLTVTAFGENSLVFHCSHETMSRTVATRYHPGTGVNLERPLRLSGELHGHLVTGHIDETATVLKVERSGGGMTVWISCSARYSDLLVEKGSVAVSGISLTVASAVSDRFAVALIPETLARSNASDWKPGFRVNLEYDIIGKYVKKQTIAVMEKERMRKNLEQ